MKKLSKKAKMIILTTIMIIIVTIGIIISANIIKVNIANEKYKSSNGGSNNEKLLPEYIKKRSYYSWCYRNIRELKYIRCHSDT